MSRRIELTQDQINFYNEQGYLVVDGIFSPDECDALLAVVTRHADENYSAILQLGFEVPEVANAMKDSNIIHVLETLQGAVIDGLMTQIFFKKAGTPYAAQAWNPHQDNAYPQAKSGAFVTINLCLDNADRENGCLYLYPGSHKEGLLPFAPMVSYRETPGTRPGNMVDLPEKYRGRERDVVVKKGGMLILHGEVVHGSHPNVSLNRSRPVFQATYINQGVDFIPGKNAKRTRIPLR